MKVAAALLGALALAAAAPALAQNAAAGPSAGQPIDPHQFGPGLRSVKFEAQNMDKSIAFYTALGMKVVIKRDATVDLGWDGPTQNSGIQLVTTAYASRGKMVRGGTMMIFMTPDIVATAERLRKAGVADVPQPRSMGGLAAMMMVNDPDGNRIELIGPSLPAR
jgi:predicted enzyme related to lactoylglutathione lyase